MIDMSGKANRFFALAENPWKNGNFTALCIRSFEYGLNGGPLKNF